MSCFCEMREGLVILYTILRTELMLPICSTTTLHIYLRVTNKPLAVTSSRVHSITYEGQIETIRKSISFVLLLESGDESIH